MTDSARGPVPPAALVLSDIVDVVRFVDAHPGCDVRQIIAEVPRPKGIPPSAVWSPITDAVEYGFIGAPTGLEVTDAGRALLERVGDPR